MERIPQILIPVLSFARSLGIFSPRSWQEPHSQWPRLRNVGRRRSQAPSSQGTHPLGSLHENAGSRIWDSGCAGGAAGPAQIPGALLRAKSREKIQKYGGKSTERRPVSGLPPLAANYGSQLIRELLNSKENEFLLNELIRLRIKNPLEFINSSRCGASRAAPAGIDGLDIPGFPRIPLEQVAKGILAFILPGFCQGKWGFAGNLGSFRRIRDAEGAEGAGMGMEPERSGCSDKAAGGFFLGILMRLKLCSAIKS